MLKIICVTVFSCVFIGSMGLDPPGQCHWNAYGIPGPESGCCGIPVARDIKNDTTNEDSNEEVYNEKTYEKLAKPDHLKHRTLFERNADSNTLPQKFIAGGPDPVNVGLNWYPWVVRLHIESQHGWKKIWSSSSTYCAGSLISPLFVLTAAHCLFMNVVHFEDIKIYLGDYDTTTYPLDCDNDKCSMNIMRHPKRIIIHPEYNIDTLENDIALLLLNAAAPYTESIRPICLPPFDIDALNLQHLPLIVAGWGTTPTAYSSNVLLATEVSLIPHSQCADKDPILVEMPDGHLCAGTETMKDACKGDSGGPLVMAVNGIYYLVGITSYGPPKCGFSPAGAYTNVYKYLDWIDQNVI